ncbi:MAG: glycosyltransferase [Oscillospiraceae bacterium]|nr:glycosyltransferase [Oscillospiraceae bacterium]
MVITFVVDIFTDMKNGTSMTAHRFVEALRRRGHEVRVLAIGEPGPDNYYVREADYGFISKIGHNQGFSFAKFDETTVRRALEGSDIVHFLLPMPFEIQVYHLAKKMGIPCSAAFHMQPENASYIIHIEKIAGINDAIYKLLYQMFYKHFRHIHCPSKFIAGELKKHQYDAKLYVISNGVDDAFRPMEVEKATDPEKFNILMTGRLSPEKRQEVLIEAVKRSKYRDKIQIYLAGAGSQMMEGHLTKCGESLPNPPIIRFYSQADLIRLINSCDLYVHTATVEIEAIACLEALTCGLVPVICNSPKSATVQFALDENSLFHADDPTDLAGKIDYWIEHPEEKKALGKQYAKYGDGFRVSESVKKAEFMFRQAIADQRGKKPYDGR